MWNSVSVNGGLFDSVDLRFLLIFFLSFLDRVRLCVCVSRVFICARINQDKYCDDIFPDRYFPFEQMWSFTWGLMPNVCFSWSLLLIITFDTSVFRRCLTRIQECAVYDSLIRPRRYIQRDVKPSIKVDPWIEVISTTRRNLIMISIYPRMGEREMVLPTINLDLKRSFILQLIDVRTDGIRLHHRISIQPNVMSPETREGRESANRITSSLRSNYGVKFRHLSKVFLPSYSCQ